MGLPKTPKRQARRTIQSSTGRPSRGGTMPASDSYLPLRPEGLAKKEQRSLPTPAHLQTASPIGRLGQMPLPTPTGDAPNPCSLLFSNWRNQSRLGPTDQGRPLSKDQEIDVENKAGHSSQPQYQGLYPMHLHDSTMRPSWHDRTQAVL